MLNVDASDCFMILVRVAVYIPDVWLELTLRVLSLRLIMHYVQLFTDLCMMPDWFMYTVLHVWTRSAHCANNVTEQAMLMLSPQWQQQAQQQSLLTAGDTNTNANSTTAAVPLKLDLTTLATVLKLRCVTDLHYVAAVRFLVKHTGFVSYDVLADVHSTQSVLLDTQGNHTIGVSPELICTTLWNSDTFRCTIDEYGISISTKTSTSSSSGMFVARAVVPLHASLSLDVLNCAIKLSEQQNSAQVYTSDVISAIIILHWGLHAEVYWTTKAKQSIPITLALPAYYLLYFWAHCSSTVNASTTTTNTYTTAPLIQVCWELIEIVITWCVLTTAAVHKLDAQASDNFPLIKRAFALFLYHGWALVSTIMLVSSRVQSQAVRTNSIYMTTITAVVLLLMSLLNHLQLYKQTASAWCSRLFHQIPIIRAWLATAVMMYIAHTEVFSVIRSHEAAIAEYKQAICFWLRTSNCDNSSTTTQDSLDKGQWFTVAVLAAPGVIVTIITVCETLYKMSCIWTNATSSTAAAKWRQQQAYMIQSSYSAGSAVRRYAIDAYLKNNCYIQVLQPVSAQHASTVVTTVAAAHDVKVADDCAITTVSTIDSVSQEELLNSVKADMSTSHSSIIKALQLLVKVLRTTDAGVTSMIVSMMLTVALMVIGTLI
jgi:hypothetical protein